MPRIISQLNSFDFKSLLKSLTGIDFAHSNDGPQNALFTIRAQGIENIENPCLEWCVKSNTGILLITEPITRLSFWKLPDDISMGTLNRNEAERQIIEDFTYYLESIEQAAYVASSRYGISIKMDRSNDPRLFIFIGNHKSEDDFITAVSTIDNLLPQLLATA